MARNLEAAHAISDLASTGTALEMLFAVIFIVIVIASEGLIGGRPGGDPGLPVSFHVQRVIRVEAFLHIHRLGKLSLIPLFLAVVLLELLELLASCT